MQFDRYELVAKLASGGMGEIYLATQQMFATASRMVVLKRIRPELATAPEFVSSFLNEARLCARLTHPNIAQIYDAGRVGDEYFIAMEYVRGTDLGQLLKVLRERNERMPVPVALSIFCDLCEGLDFAHRARGDDGTPLGIIHRDVTPSNVLLSNDGIAKIADFGIAKTSDPDNRTKTGALKGKYGYLSPEQIRLAPIDKRVDVFAAGIVLFEMLSGKNPFHRENEFFTLSAIRDEEPSYDEIAAGPMGAGLERLLRGCLAKQPDARTSSLREAMETAQQIALAHGVSVSHPQVEALLARLHLEREAPPLGGAPSGSDGETVSRTREASGALVAEGREPETVVAPALPERHPRLGRIVGVAAASAIVLVVAGSLASRWTPSRAQLAQAAPAVTSVLTVESAPPGAQVLVDGVLVTGVTPLAVTTLQVGRSYELRVVRDQHREEVRQVTPRAQNENLSIVMTRLSPASAPVSVPRPPAAATRPPSRAVMPDNRVASEPSRLLCRVVSPSGAWAHVSIDGRDVGDTPLPAIEVSPGPHEVRFWNEELKRDVTRTVTVEPGETLTVPVRLVD